MAMYHPQSYVTNETSQKLQQLIPMTDMTLAVLRVLEQMRASYMSTGAYFFLEAQ